MEQSIGLVESVGFPIAVSVYLLVRIKGKIDKISLSIHELSAVIENMKE